MKAYILILSALLFITTESFAQLPDGSIAPDFTTTDVNGNEHRLYDYLDNGYTVILDISATWCGPCWNYHIGGTFEEIWEAHGPAGEPGVSSNTTDDVMILWFEGDVGTALSELENSDFGNWLAPEGNEVFFPMSNDDNIASLYQLPYWPVIYTICPNRTLVESGQLTAAAHYNGISNCPTETEGTNAAILNINTDILPDGCGASASGNFSVVVQNMGTENLTSFTVEVSSNGQSIATEDFSGNLNLFETTTVNFGNITVDGETIDVEITSSDDNDNDNTLTHSVNFSTVQSSQMVTVNLLTDNYGNETYMQITDENNNVIWFEGNEAVAGNVGTGQLAPEDATNPLGNNQVYEWDVTLPSTGCFKFEITDYYGDGLAASTNTNGGVDGDWSIEDNNGVIIAQQTVQNFENEDDSYFENTEAGTSSIGENEKVSFSIYPNPVNTNATIEVNLSENSNVRLDIVNVLGEVALSESHRMNSGNNSININVSQLTSGIYFAHLTVNGETKTTKITVTK